MKFRTLSFVTKLRRLEAQINSASLADYAYADGQAALTILQGRTRSAIARIRDTESLSPTTLNSVLRDANFLLIRATYIIGIIVRSTSVRNGFELYAPFLDICHKLLGDDARLILSSEWQYVPFTYPQSLQELPNFVIIGLPASESDNVLIFPSAGHELGHSVWIKHALATILGPIIISYIDEAFLQARSEIELNFQIPRTADFEQDMFVQMVKSSVFKSAIAQTEEYFSDFLGMILFGESYLHAFEFLIAPQLSGARSSSYPDTHRRSKVISDYALTKLGITIDAYSDSFISDQPPATAQDKLILRLADVVTERVLEQTYSTALGVVTDAKVSTPTAAQTQVVEKDFVQGVPFDGDAAIGDLINAAWHIYKSMEQAVFTKQGREPDEYLSDLVLKSAEIHEIKRYMP